MSNISQQSKAILLFLRLRHFVYHFNPPIIDTVCLYRTIGRKQGRDDSKRIILL